MAFRTAMTVAIILAAVPGCALGVGSPPALRGEQRAIVSDADQHVYHGDESPVAQPVRLPALEPADENDGNLNAPHAAPSAVRQVGYVQESELPPPLDLFPSEPVEPSQPLPGGTRLEEVPEVVLGAVGLPELEQMALAGNPALAQAAAQVAAARGNWVQVGLYPNPTIGYSAEEIGEEGGAGQQGGFVSQQFVTGGKLGLNRAAASFDVRAAEQGLAAQRLRVLTDVRLAYFDALAAQRRIEVAQRLVRTGAEAVQTSEALVQVGEATEVDTLQLRVQTDQARLLLNNAQNGYRESWRRLAAVVGAPAMPPAPLLGELERPAPAIAWEEALGRLLAASPQLAQALAEAESARWAYQRAKVEVIPDPNLQVAVRGDTASGDTLTSIQLGVPIPLFDRNQGRIREAYAQIAAAEQQVARIELGLQEQLAVVYRRYANARQQAELYAEHILPHAERSVELTQSAYEAGEVGYLNLLTAQQTYFQAMLAYVDSLEDLWAAVMEIEGLLLQGSLQDEAF